MIVILLIPFQARYSQAGDEMEGGDTNTVYGVMDTMGTTYMYTMNMIRPSLATGILYMYIPSFHPGRIWAFSYSPVEYIALLASQLLLGKPPLYIQGYHPTDLRSEFGLHTFYSWDGIAGRFELSFCVNPLRKRIGDSVMMDNFRSLRGREKYRTPRRTTCCWSLGGAATLWIVLLT